MPVSTTNNCKPLVDNLPESARFCGINLLKILIIVEQYYICYTFISTNLKNNNRGLRESGEKNGQCLQ
jgi:hypothetical protein